MNRYIKRVKLTKGKLQIEYETPAQHGLEKVKYESYENYTPQQLDDCITSLGDWVLKICELPKGYFDPIKRPEKLIDDLAPSGRVFQIDFDWKNKDLIWGASITAKKELNKVYKPIEIKTPFLWQESDHGPVLPAGCAGVLGELLSLADVLCGQAKNVVIATSESDEKEVEAA